MTLPAGTPQTVTWNVSGTNAAPINTASVNILLSTDGGATFPLSLASATPNDGTQAVTLPAIATTQARVKIEAVGNIFFDVSDANFTITTGNAAPVANADATSTPVNTAVMVNVLANDTDSDGSLDPDLRRGHRRALARGDVGQRRRPASSRTRRPAASTGPDSFTYTVDDDDGATSNAATVSIAVGSGAPVDVFPSSFTVQTGALAGGTAASLNADDDAYLVRERRPKTSPRTATWYGTFTGVDNATTTLQTTYSGKSSVSCTQTISIWRWTDSTWVDLDTRTVGTTEVEVAGVGPSGALDPFVSGTTGLGDARIRVSCSNTGGPAFALSGDLLKLTVGTGGGTQTLTVTTAGAGTGTVTSSPPGINCRADCCEPFAGGTVVTLTAAPGPSSTFAGWSGACAGSGACQVTMNAPSSVTATFTASGDRRLPLLVHRPDGHARQRVGREPERR